MYQYLDFSKSEVCQFVHEAVEQCLGSTSIHTELSLGGEVVRLLQGRQHVTVRSCNNIIHEIHDIVHVQKAECLYNEGLEYRNEFYLELRSHPQYNRLRIGA